MPLLADLNVFSEFITPSSFLPPADLSASLRGWCNRFLRFSYSVAIFIKGALFFALFGHIGACAVTLQLVDLPNLPPYTHCNPFRTRISLLTVGFVSCFLSLTKHALSVVDERSLSNYHSIQPWGSLLQASRPFVAAWSPIKFLAKILIP